MAVGWGGLFAGCAAGGGGEDRRVRQCVGVRGVRQAGADRGEGLVLVDQRERMGVVVRDIDAQIADSVGGVGAGEAQRADSTRNALRLAPGVPVVVALEEAGREAVEQKATGVRRIAKNAGDVASRR